MQKKLIALAVAGLVSGSAFAQTNVTMYGVVDMYGARTSATGASSGTHINSGGQSGSRLGFRGTEDLGNGLKALFTLEYALAADDNTGVGTGATAARQQFLGLTGDFGTAVAGRLQTAGYDFACATSSVAGSQLDPFDKVGNALGVYSATKCSTNGRVGNAFAYISPVMSGFKVAYNHARLTENIAKLDEDTANMLYGTYTNGPLALGAIYSKVSRDSTPVTAAVPNDDVKEFGLNGSYDLKVVKFFGGYVSSKPGTAAKNNKFIVAGTVPVSAAGGVHLQYAKLNRKSTTASDNATSWSLAYTHSLSKRTNLYGGYIRVSNDDFGRVAAVTTPVAKNAAGDDVAADTSSSTLAVGVRHMF